MKIGSILSHKGEFVATISPDESVARLLELLSEHNIGAVVVTNDDDSVSGIVSERDVVRGGNDIGKKILKRPVSSIMTPVVATCTVDSQVEELMVTMTEERVRHIPVMDEESGRMVGIVSIGDVVRARIDHLEDEKKNLVNYITS
ncbi:MAG: CBS domain-containing protein [Candidatus Nanopelagicales bacterium]